LLGPGGKAADELIAEPEETQGEDLSNTKSKMGEELVVQEEEDDENPAAKQNSEQSVTESEESAPYAPSNDNKDSEH